MHTGMLLIQIPQKTSLPFVETVDFFPSPCIFSTALLNYYVACYRNCEVIALRSNYGFLVRVLHWCTHQSMDNAMEKMDLTAAQGQVMAYLAHAQQPPCPRDLESEFHLTHPTVSGLLSRLEQKGFIALQTDPQDRRCKRIYVLEKGRQCHEVMHRTIRENESRMVQGFTPEEQEIFSGLLQRAIQNMGGDPTPRRFKEDNNE